MNKQILLKYAGGLLLAACLAIGGCSGNDPEEPAPGTEENPPSAAPDTPDTPTDIPLLMPCDQEATLQTQQLYSFLRSVYRQKCLSSTMASANWNTTEADFVFRLTGKYPAIHCFDFIHLPYSPSDWIDYTDLTPVRQWAEAGGIVSLMWHFLVPETENSQAYTYDPEQTTFRPLRALENGTWENTYYRAQLDQLCATLSALQAAGIPALWRPFHEAAGNAPTGGKAWFWWGSDGAAAYVRLWKHMYDYLRQQGIHNLIWVWTAQNNGDDDWYPGDDCVDIVGRDLYGQNATTSAAEWTALSQRYASKMIALTECGNAVDGRKVTSAQSTIGEQWSSKGARWLYFMPWYDYAYDNAQAAENVMCLDSFWQNAVSRGFVLTRDDVKSIYQ